MRTPLRIQATTPTRAATPLRGTRSTDDREIMHCDSLLQNIDALIDNELSHAEETECRAHLHTCAACTAAHDERRDLKELVSSRAARPAVPSGLENKIRLATRRQSPHRARKWVRAAAALILAGCIVILTVSQTGDRRLTHASASSECAKAFERILTDAPWTQRPPMPHRSVVTLGKIGSGRHSRTSLASM